MKLTSYFSAVQPVPTTTSGPSWADRVKGRQVVKPVAVMAPSPPTETPPTDDIKNKKNEELTKAAIKEEATKESQKEGEKITISLKIFFKFC